MEGHGCSTMATDEAGRILDKILLLEKIIGLRTLSKPSWTRAVSTVARVG